MERSRKEERERGLKTCASNKISGRGERERETDRKKGGRGRETEGQRQRQLEKREGRKKKQRRTVDIKLTLAGCELPKIQKSPVSE